jgi:curved DNA-binding protein
LAAAAAGSDLTSELSLSLQEVLTGTEKTVSLRRGERIESVSVKVPAGIEEGKRLRLSGKGYPGQGGGPAGDLYLVIKILPHSLFSREGNDLVINREVPFSGACLGMEIEVPSLEGTQLKVKVPAGMQPGGKLRLKGHGLPAGPAGKRSDLYVRVIVEVPRSLSAEQQKLIKELAKTGL